MLDEEYDPDMVPEAEEAVNAVGKAVDELQLMTMLSGEYDANNAILTFHAGAGGTEAQDWTEMLYRMYTRWAERHGYTYQTDGLRGRRRGGHQVRHHPHRGRERLRPISRARTACTDWSAYLPSTPTPGGRPASPPWRSCRSWTTTVEIEIRPEDIEMQACRSSGAGGQHINKTSSAVRLTHLPTGIVVVCQTERSQFQNRDNAMKMLRAKLAELKMQQHAEKISDLKGVQMKIEWGSQIRSYVFMPYTAGQGHPHRLRDRPCRCCDGW